MQKTKFTLTFLVLVLSLVISPSSVATSEQPVDNGSTSIDPDDIYDRSLYDYSSYLGSSSPDRVQEVTTDNNGNHLVVGYTNGDDFPTVNTNNSGSGGWGDVYIGKYSPDWQLLNLTLLGGSDSEGGHGIHDTGNGYIVTGQTFSDDFPQINSNYYRDTSAFSPDTFIAFYDYDLNLQWTDVIGGSDYDNVYDSTFVTTSRHNYTYIVGRTSSTDFPTNSSFGYSDTMSGPQDGFILQYDMYFRTFKSTYFGGDGYDNIDAVTVDKSNNLVITGESSSLSVDGPLSFPAPDTYQGSDDVFVAKFDAGLYPSLDLHWARLLGGYEGEHVSSIAVDSENNIIVAGSTYSYNFTTMNAYRDYMAGDQDGIIIKLDQYGETLMSTFFGGSGRDSIDYVDVDSHDRLVTISSTYHEDFPMKNAFATQKDINRQGSVVSVFSDYPQEETDNNLRLLFSSFTQNNLEMDSGKLSVNNDLITIVGSSGWQGSNLTVTPDAFQSEPSSGEDTIVQGLYHPLVDHDEDGLLSIHDYLTGGNHLSNDTDNDGIDDAYEYEHGLQINVDDANKDLDSDGMPNGWEHEMNLSASDNSDMTGDPDEDGLINIKEYKFNTDARNPDTDNDGLLDGEEVHQYGTDPLSSDTDSDGVSDFDEVFGSDNSSDSTTQDTDNSENDVEDTSSTTDTDGGDNTGPTDTDDSFLPFGMSGVMGALIIVGALGLKRRSR